MVVEDEEIMRDACFASLCENGYKVELAENGMVGLDKVKSIKPDLAIVDIRMPGIDGLEVLKRINEIDPRIVTIVITGYATIEYAVQSMKNGAYDFLPKPFVPDELRLVVKRGLEKRRLVAEMEAHQREKKRMTDFFISIISHQLRTPLVAVKQYFEVILGDMAGEISDESRDILKRAGARLDELIELVEEWLSLARFDPNKVKGGFKPLNIVEILKHHIEFLAPLFKERGIKIQLNCCENLPSVNGNEHSIGEVFANLISNAAKYNRDNGKITIYVRVENDMCCIQFEDTGIGISKEDLPFIFNDFFRVRSKETMGIKGTGLGLPIVKRIVETHGGSVKVESECGKGSTFSVYLPFAQEKREASIA